MKILYVINSGSPGGVEQHVLDLVKTFSTSENFVYVWCLPGTITSWYEGAGATVKTDKAIRFDIDPFYILDLASFLISEQVEVVHAHELKAGTNALLAATMAQVPAKITHIHTPMSEWQVQGKAKKLITKVQTRLYSLLVNLLSSREIALTESRKKVKIIEGIKPEKLEVIPNALDFSKFDVSGESILGFKSEVRSRFRIPENSFLFGNVGRHTEEKGLDILIKAFSEIVKSYPGESIYLLLAGGGKLEEEHKKLAENLHITDKVLFTGIFPDDDKLKYYCALDAFVFPSRAEGFGIVLMEAMYMGLPVVSSNLEVLREVGSDTIKYFEKDKVESLTQQMREIYNDPERFNQRSREKIQNNYSLEKFKQSYSDLYIKLIGKREQ